MTPSRATTAVLNEAVFNAAQVKSQSKNTPLTKGVFFDWKPTLCHFSNLPKQKIRGRQNTQHIGRRLAHNEVAVVQ